MADVLLCLEDAGAANVLAPLLAPLQASGLTVVAFASGAAHGYLVGRGLGTLLADPCGTPNDIVNAVRPRLVLIGTAENPDTLGLALIPPARARGIPTVAFADTGVNADRRFCGRTTLPMTFAPDWLLVPDASARKAFVTAGWPAERVIACGNPHRSHVAGVGRRLAAEGKGAVRRRRLPGAPAGRPVVVFVSEGAARLYHQAAPELQDRTETALQRTIEAARPLEPRPYLVLRLHPKDRPSDFDDFADAVDVVDGGGDPLALVYAADAVVGPTSMLLQEAAWLGVPTVLSVRFADQTEWLGSAREGLTQSAHTAAGLAAALGDALRAGPSATVQGPATVEDAAGQVIDLLNRLMTSDRGLFA